jgi:hypothetical protein
VLLLSLLVSAVAPAEPAGATTSRALDVAIPETLRKRAVGVE